MTNGDIEVMRVLEEAVSAAIGPGGALESQPSVVLEQEAGEPGQAAPASSSGKQAEGALGLQPSSWLNLAPLEAGGSSSSGASKPVSWLNPLVGGLLSLFGQEEETGAAGPAKAVRASKIHYEAGFSGEDGELVEIDRDERGQVRESAQTPQVVVNIETMDSRSFLDRTPEIAEAVKRALLETESLGRLMGGE